MTDTPETLMPVEMFHAGAVDAGTMVVFADDYKDLERRLATAHNDALEEAIKVAMNSHRDAEASEIADAIRALKK